MTPSARRDSNRRPTHPGVLLREVVESTGLTRTEIAARLGVSRQHFYDVMDQRKPVSATMAARLGRFFGNGGELWLRMQMAHDLWQAERDEDVLKVRSHAA